jgi:hypothetical protein
MLRFSDDIALIAESKEDLVQLIKTMDKSFKKVLEMRINVKKTQVLVCERENSTRIQIKIRNQTIEVDEFTCAISKDGRNKSGIIKFICQAILPLIKGKLYLHQEAVA